MLEIIAAGFKAIIFCDICNYRGGLCDHVEERR